MNKFLVRVNIAKTLRFGIWSPIKCALLCVLPLSNWLCKQHFHSAGEILNRVSSETSIIVFVNELKLLLCSDMCVLCKIQAAKHLLLKQLCKGDESSSEDGREEMEAAPLTAFLFKTNSCVNIYNENFTSYEYYLNWGKFGRYMHKYVYSNLLRKLIAWVLFNCINRSTNHVSAMNIERYNGPAYIKFDTKF